MLYDLENLGWYMSSIKKYRKMANLTQEQLGILAGLAGQAAISNYELGIRKPKFEHLIAIKKVLVEKGISVTVDDLIFGSSE